MKNVQTDCELPSFIRTSFMNNSDHLTMGIDNRTARHALGEFLVDLDAVHCAFGRKRCYRPRSNIDFVTRSVAGIAVCCHCVTD